MPKILAVIFLAFFSSTAVFAQSWEFGGRLGGAGYLGDLNTNNPVKVSGISAGAFVKYNFNPYISARLGYTYGYITAADSISSNAQLKDRNLSFSTHLNELSLTGELNFLDYVPSISKNVFTPFIFGGAALVKYNPVASYQGTLYQLRLLNTEGQTNSYTSTTWAIPYGVGFKYNFVGRLNLMADIGYRYVHSDYLDDVSGNYAAKAKFTNEIARALSDRSGEKNNVYIGNEGTQRGDQRAHDTYFFIGLSISYTFITQKCYY